MSLLSEAIKNDSGLVVGTKYLIDMVGPFSEMPLTGDTDHVKDFQIENRIDELEELIYKMAPSASVTNRMRFLSEQLLSFALESGVPLGDSDAFATWVDRNGNLEDKVMETVFEIDLLMDNTFTMISREIQELEVIRKNLLLNHTIFQELQMVMISGGPGSEEEFEAFEQAVFVNLEKARRILSTFNPY